MLHLPVILFPLAGGSDQPALPTAALRARRMGAWHQKWPDEQWRAFVSQGARTGKLSTVRADGSPHVAPIWFLLDGDHVLFNTAKDTVKGRNLARDGRVRLCVDDDRPPFDFVVLEGRAELSEDLDELVTGQLGSAHATWAKIGPRSSGSATASRVNSSSA